MLVKECRLIQCFNCYEYEQIDKKYKMSRNVIIVRKDMKRIDVIKIK